MTHSIFVFKVALGPYLSASPPHSQRYPPLPPPSCFDPGPCPQTPFSPTHPPSPPNPNPNPNPTLTLPSPSPYFPAPPTPQTDEFQETRDFVFRTKESTKLSTTLEFYIEKFMSVMQVLSLLGSTAVIALL